MYGIIAITFTNKAAGEMKERLTGMLGEGGNGKWICTIHSMCVKILREFGDRIGVKTNFSIYSETERNNIIKKSFRELDYDDERLLKSVKYHIGNAKMLGLDPDRYGRKFAFERNIDDIFDDARFPDDPPSREQRARLRRPSFKDPAPFTAR